MHVFPNALPSRNEIRRRAFLFQDGIVLAATFRALDALGLLAADLEEGLEQVLAGLPATGRANLAVGLRSLEQAGLVESQVGSKLSWRLKWTAEGQALLAWHPLILALGDFLACFDGSGADAWRADWGPDLRRRLVGLAEAAGAAWGELDEVTCLRLEGAAIAPLLLALRAWGALARQNPPFEQFGPGAESLLASRGWIAADGGWTPQGRRWTDVAELLGLTASYLPLLARLPQLYRGEPMELASAGAREWHVQRELNVAASTAAHSRYFAEAADMIRDRFRASPNLRPRAVIDVGCGDGAWLAHVHALIAAADGPAVRLVGVDQAPESLARARARLTGLGAEPLLIVGDVTEPEVIAARLRAHGLELADALHLHAFVHHDRRIDSSEPPVPPEERGAFIGSPGEPLSAGTVEADLARHFARWKPYVGRHGMIVIEAHRVPTELSLRHRGALHSIAFDAYHAYSRQYPLERSRYVRAVEQAGLRFSAADGRLYPSSRPFVAVSLERLLPAASGATSGSVAEAEGDGEALHRLLYEAGDLARPRAWCAPATRRLVRLAVDAFAEALEQSAPGDTLRVCDYGTGTGLAAVELAKAIDETGLGARMRLRNVGLEMLLVDIPSPWFEEGQRLLGDVPGISFHPLTDAAGRFRPLREVTEGRTVDVIVASMVLHLLGPSALARVAVELASIAHPGTPLLWNTPDLAATRAWAVPFHEANRRLRARWTALLRGELPARSEIERAALAGAPRSPQGRPAILDHRAGRRILPQPSPVERVDAAFARAFTGAVSTEVHEMTAGEILDVLRVPSNGREFLPEIPDDMLRNAFIDHVMGEDILPPLCRGPAGTGLGVGIEWATGSYTKVADAADAAGKPEAGRIARSGSTRRVST